ncbi:hypothetical protein ACFVYD_01770 [Streptomyces sp. NPDC058301]|uniref:hypothetical protein n=1 Tax=Streptomyces sp. NPDC058301 TaxID=3346436 RepID=UPI0036EDE44D
MDQRTDDQHAALNAAALNPAHIPGLMPAPAAEPELKPEAKSEPTPEPEPKSEHQPDAETQTQTETEDAAGDDRGPAAPPEADDDANPEDGPVLFASDRRGSITADRSGIRLRLDDEEADFGWDELSAVEYATSRWSRRFTITVHLPRPRWFRTDVQAEDRASLAQWSEQLEEVLNAYFEEE